MPIEPILLCDAATGVGDPVPTSPPKPHHPISLGLQALLDWDHIFRVKQNPLAYDRNDDFGLVGAELGVDPPTVFCRPCRRLLRSPPKLRSSRDSDRKSDWVPFHTDLFDIISCCHNPKGNCPLCQQFWKSIKHVIVGFRVMKESFRLSLPKRGLQVRLEAQRVHFAGEGSRDSFTLTLNLIIRDDDDDFAHYPVGVTFFYDDQGNRSSRLGLPFENRSDSVNTFSLVKKWIGDCRERHEKCKVNPDLLPPRPPARLISIEPSGQHFRLEELARPKEQDESQEAPRECHEVPKYTALSYRWSSRASIMLKKYNLKEMRKLLPVSLLPRTLRDACTITLRLGLQNIWIDRLCIIQDSDEDWECESSKMADVYRNAWCTISATGAVDDNGGCYFHRNPLEILPLVLTSNPFVKGRFYLDRNNYYQPDHDQMIYGHLRDRAWTFQERNLSRRILHFTKDQVYWQCRESSACEAWPDFYTDTSTRSFPLSEVKHEYDYLHRWTKIVNEYSLGRLSFEKDKLPALSGMAAEMQLALGDTYLAGLWREHLLFGLCWRAKSQHAKRPEAYRAPSWSWASLESDISNPAEITLFCNLSPDKINTGFQDVASIEDVQVRPSSSTNPYGQVDSGWIEISSHLFQVYFSDERFGSYQRRRITSLDGKSLKRSDYSSVFLDGDHSLPASDENVPTFCLPLLYGEDYSEKKLYCLLLVPHSLGLFACPRSEASLPSSNTNTRYHRVGLAEVEFRSNDRHDFLKRCTKQTVVIF